MTFSNELKKHEFNEFYLLRVFLTLTFLGIEISIILILRHQNLNSLFLEKTDHELEAPFTLGFGFFIKD
jgi:hypothetical protein